MTRENSNLLRRVLSSLVLLPTALVFLFLGEWWFFGLILVAMTVATWEFVRMLSRARYHPRYVFSIGIVWAILFTFHLSDASYLQPAFAFLLFTSLSWHVLCDRTATPIENWLLPLAGALYIAWSGGHMLLLRAFPRGHVRLLMALSLTWIADTGAYFVGRAWGTHPMAPRLSPKKTWEGLIGGILSAVVCGPILAWLFRLEWIHGIVLGLLISTLTPLGDLGVSMIKRQVGVKDSSSLIPGHGGVFDRVDSLLIAALVGYYYYAAVMAVFPFC